MNAMIQPTAIQSRFRLPFGRIRQATSNWIGMDLGQYATKVVWINKRPNLTEISKASCSVLPESPTIPVQDGDPSSEPADATWTGEDRRSGGCNPFRTTTLSAATEGDLWDSQSIAQRVAQARSLFESKPLGHVDLAVNLSMEACDIRGVCLPDKSPVNDQTIRKQLAAAKGEFGRSSIALLPNHSADASKLRVFSVEEATAMQVVRTCEQQQWQVRQLTGLPWCSQRALSYLDYVEENELCLVLDWSYGRPTLTLATKSELKYVRRTRSRGLGELLEKIQLEFDLGIREAARCLERVSDNSKQFDPAFHELVDMVKSYCLVLVEEIESALEYARWQFRKESLSKLIVIGGGAVLPRLVTALQDALRELEVRPWEAKIGGEILTGEFAVATALAQLEVDDGNE